MSDLLECRLVRLLRFHIQEMRASLVEIGIQPFFHESMWPVEVVDLSTSSASSLGFVRRVSTFYGRPFPVYLSMKPSALNTCFNFDVPLTAAGYGNRIGRTGRAGNSGRASTLIRPKEEDMLGHVEEVLGRRS
ncbi:hypothetical protein R1flu_025256 [Riccia fluitans]|uniref:Uncharacterized protein n=1 Tax=Riccia fluitans TaxID=41844 RepID=A0ABD1XX85_9MARC